MILDGEKRLFPRIAIKWSVIVQTRQGIVNTETHNISVEGAFIRFWNPLAANEVFKMLIKVPNLDRQLSVDAQVVWRNGRESEDVAAAGGAGVKFTKITTRDRNLLDELISTRPYSGDMSQDT